MRFKCYHLLLVINFKIMEELNIAQQLTLEFVDDFIDTFTEEEFIEWVNLSKHEPDFDEIITELKKRLIQLEYYDKLQWLKKYKL